MRDAPLAYFRLPSARVDGLRWAIPKTDRLLIPSGAMATKFVILDAVRQRRGSRDYISNKPYARLVARLGPISKAEAQRVPPFNPFKLYANTTPVGDSRPSEDGQQDAASRSSSCWAACCRPRTARSSAAEEVAEVVRARAIGRRAKPASRDPAEGQEAPDAWRPAGRAVGARAPSSWPRAQHVRAGQVGVSRPRTPVDDLDGREVRVVKAAARRHAGARPGRASAPRPGRPGP